MTPTRIKHYRAQGWQLREVDEEEHHNGNPYTAIYVKSPRLDEEVTFYDTLESLSEDELLDKELNAYIYQRLEDYTNREAIGVAFRKVLARDPDAKKVTVTVRLQ